LWDKLIRSFKTVYILFERNSKLTRNVKRNLEHTLCKVYNNMENNASGINAISTYLVITFRRNESVKTIDLRLCGTRKRSPIKVLGNADLSHDLFRCLHWLRGSVAEKSYTHCATSQRWFAIFFYEILNHSIRESRTLFITHSNAWRILWKIAPKSGNSACTNQCKISSPTGRSETFTCIQRNLLYYHEI